MGDRLICISLPQSQKSGNTYRSKLIPALRQLLQVALQQVALQQVALQQVALQQVALQQVALQQVALQQVALQLTASSAPQHIRFLIEH
jgi:hypothetical protein